ncbi:MAG: hypothetical protein LIO95_07355 [Clostridiales bacterium]|nr:hypothetical protein [Clostridiales bacterium]
MTNVVIRTGETCRITLHLARLDSLELLRDLGIPKCRRLLRLLFTDRWRNEAAIIDFTSWLEYIVSEAKQAHEDAKAANAAGHRCVPRGTKREAAAMIRARNKQLKYAEDNARRNKDFAVKLAELFQAEEAV